jgi:hypothetical protein
LALISVLTLLYDFSGIENTPIDKVGAAAVKSPAGDATAAAMKETGHMLIPFRG